MSLIRRSGGHPSTLGILDGKGVEGITIIYGHVGSVCSVVIKRPLVQASKMEELEFIRYGDGCMVMRKWAA
jgi:hypothetical protein